MPKMGTETEEGLGDSEDTDDVGDLGDLGDLGVMDRTGFVLTVGFLVIFLLIFFVFGI